VYVRFLRIVVDWAARLGRGSAGIRYSSIP
jgi:hypothetical protein